MSKFLDAREALRLIRTTGSETNQAWAAGQLRAALFEHISAILDLKDVGGEALAPKLSRVLEAIPAEPITGSDLDKKLGLAWGNTAPALKTLRALGLLERLGRGVTGDPYKWRRPL